MYDKLGGPAAMSHRNDGACEGQEWRVGKEKWTGLLSVYYLRVLSF